jgi:thioredoxin-related protein
MNFVRGLVSIATGLLITFGAMNALATSKSATGVLKSAHGLYIQSWFKQSSGDLRKDMLAAQKAGKTLAIFWEQDGCHYCQAMHEENLRDKSIVDYINSHFYVIQLDLHGNKMASDWDGNLLTQSDLAGKLGVRGTPTVLFYRQAGEEVTRLPGYAKPPIFKKVFEYVVEKGDENASLIDWIRAKLSTETKG